MSRWSLNEWIPFAIALQVLFVLLWQIVQWVWPQSEVDVRELDVVINMEAIEFTERVDTPQETQDLSEEIIERDQIEDPMEVNWENAKDLLADFDTRYVPRFLWNTSRDDYPASARNANLGNVTLQVELLVGTSGRIMDVKVLGIRSDGGGHDAFREDFIRAAKRVITTKTRLATNPYRDSDGTPQMFRWKTTVTFRIGQ